MTHEEDPELEASSRRISLMLEEYREVRSEMRNLQVSFFTVGTILAGGSAVLIAAILESSAEAALAALPPAQIAISAVLVMLQFYLLRNAAYIASLEHKINELARANVLGWQSFWRDRYWAGDRTNKGMRNFLRTVVTEPEVTLIFVTTGAIVAALAVTLVLSAVLLSEWNRMPNDNLANGAIVAAYVGANLALGLTVLWVWSRLWAYARRIYGEFLVYGHSIEETD